jgi:hypothetical protein
VRKTGRNGKLDEDFMAKIQQFRANIVKSDKKGETLLKSKSNALFKTRPSQKTHFSKSTVWSSADFMSMKANSTARVLASNNLVNAKGDELASARSNASYLLVNEDLNLMCPVSLHQRLANDKFDVECKCRRTNVPFINDLEFDYFIRLLPVEQLIVIVVIDS